MSCKLMSTVCLLALLLVSVIAAENVDVKSKKPMELATNISISEPQEQKIQVPAKMEMAVNEAEKMEISKLKPMQVTGFITASGSIFTVDDDKRSVGVIEARQTGPLTPQPGEFICNYGSVVVYSDRACDDVMSMKKEKKKPNKTVKTEKIEKIEKTEKTETDKETDQKQSTVANEQPQADDNTDMAAEMGTKDEDMAQVENKPMAENDKKKKIKKIKKTKKKPKKPKTNKKRTQNGVQRIRVKTKLVKRRPLQQQQNRPLRRPQNNLRPRPRPRPQQQQLQNQRRLQNRRRTQYQPQGALYTTPNGKLYDLIEVPN